MTKKRLYQVIKKVTFLYVLLVLTGILLKILDGYHGLKIYDTYKDLVPLLVAIPIGYLGFYFQRRISFVNALREQWSNMIKSVNEARQYTLDTEPNQESYKRVLRMLSESIDEMRGVYKNVNESYPNIGLYPYESIKEINKTISGLGFSKYDKVKFDDARSLIDQHWQLIKNSFLQEFDRPFPTYTNSPYVKVNAPINIWRNLKPKKKKSR